MSYQDTNYVYRDLDQLPADVSTFPALKQGGAGMQIILIQPGDLLTPHWHPNSSETTYCLSGTGTVGLLIPDPTQQAPAGATFQHYEYKKGDVVFLPQGYGHYFQNGGKEDLVILLTFENPDFDILTLADALQDLPKDIVKAAENSVCNKDENPVIPLD